MCRTQGLTLSLIRSQGGTFHKAEPECPSREEVSVTALSTYCQSDSEGETSTDGGSVNTYQSQGRVNVNPHA